jgi:hypothetical protein
MERTARPGACSSVIYVGNVDMGKHAQPAISYVIGPDGGPLTLADLPPPDTRRWVARRKAEVVAAVRGGLLSLDEACQRYALTVEEFVSWEHAIQQFGLPGLRATHMQEYRQQENRKASAA